MDVGLPVLVVGGGIAGLTCAVALERLGVDVRLVEREPSWPAAGAGLSVQPNGMRGLRSVGLSDGVAAAGTAVERWVFADDQGSVLCDIDLAEVWGAADPCVGITRRDLQDALVAAVAHLPCRLGVSVDGLDEHADGVRVGFTDGTSGDFAVVVGADGIRSTVRRLAFGEREPTFAGHISWRSVAPVVLGRSSIEFWLGDGHFFGLCPVGGGRTYGFGHVARPKGRDPQSGRLERLRHEFAGFGPDVQTFLDALHEDREIHCSAIEWVEQQRWHTERVVLIGDAAHAASPLMGQGGSLAIEDALVLADELAEATSTAEALAAYQQRRQSRVSWVHEQSRAVAESVLQLPPPQRNDVLTKDGVRAFAARYAPLVAPP